MKKIFRFIRREPVLCAAGTAALATMLFVPPSLKYLSYIDFRVLALLFCLMTVVAGFSKQSVFDAASRFLIEKAGGTRAVALILTLLCGITAMFVTNDVALLTYVPLTIMVLSMTGPKLLIYVVVLETAAANLGSMLTPVGNPQNLYLYSFYHMTPGEFFAAVLPYGLAGLALIAIGALFTRNKTISIRYSGKAVCGDAKRLTLNIVLFAVCLLTVFRVLHWALCLLIVCAAVAWADRSLFKRVDYGLLATFLCFYIFVGNVASIDAVKAAVAVALSGREILLSVLFSQVISNVPAAMMLSSFTHSGAALLVGTNIGGLGTPVASLASLISLKLYMKSKGSRPGAYLLVFTAVNVFLLAVLLVPALVR